MTLALALLLAPRRGVPEMARRMLSFVGSHFLLVDLRMCKALARIREHVAALIGAYASRQPQSRQLFPAASPSPPRSTS